MQIRQFFLNGDIKGAIAYMREHEEFQEVLPAYIAIFENCEYRTYDVPESLNQILRLYQIYYRDVFYCGLYIWRETIPAVYQVELPGGTAEYTVNILI